MIEVEKEREDHNHIRQRIYNSRKEINMTNTYTPIFDDKIFANPVVRQNLDKDDHIVLPLPPSVGEEKPFEMEVYVRFMRHLRHVPSSRTETKILASIQFTADMMEIGDALISKTLIDLGLRAPRNAFPYPFLEFVDKTTSRNCWDFDTPPASVVALKAHWDKIGESKFAGTLRTQYAVYKESCYE